MSEKRAIGVAVNAYIVGSLALAVLVAHVVKLKVETAAAQGWISQVPCLGLLSGLGALLVIFVCTIVPLCLLLEPDEVEEQPIQRGMTDDAQKPRPGLSQQTPIPR